MAPEPLLLQLEHPPLQPGPAEATVGRQMPVAQPALDHDDAAVGLHAGREAAHARDLVGDVMHDGARMHEVDLAAEDGPHVVVLDVAVRHLHPPGDTARAATRA